MRKLLVSIASLITSLSASAFDPSSPQGQADSTQPTVRMYLIQGCQGQPQKCSGFVDDAAYPASVWVLQLGDTVKAQVRTPAPANIIPGLDLPDDSYGTMPQAPQIGHFHVRIVYRGATAEMASVIYPFEKESSVVGFYGNATTEEIGDRNANDLRSSLLNRVCKVGSWNLDGNGLNYTGVVFCGNPLTQTGWYEVLTVGVQEDHDHRLGPTPWAYPVVNQSWIWVTNNQPGQNP